MVQIGKRCLQVVMLVLLASCGGGGGGGTPSAPGGGGGGGGGVTPTPATGSLVYTSQATVNGSLSKVVRVLNLATGSERLFATDDFVTGGASVSRSGVVAQVFDRGVNEAVIRLNRLDGSLVKQFVIGIPFSSSTSGARISPDGSLVAFGMRVQANRGVDRVYFCDTGAVNDCRFYDDLSDPEWMPDGRLIGVDRLASHDRQGVLATTSPLTIANTAQNFLIDAGPQNLTNAQDPYATPDGKNIIVSLGTLSNICALNIATKTTQQITSGGLQQYRATVSADGKTLFYLQQCCSNSGSAVATTGTIHAIALNVNANTATPLGVNFLTDAAGASIKNSNRFGFTQTVLP